MAVNRGDYERDAEILRKVRLEASESPKGHWEEDEADEVGGGGEGGPERPREAKAPVAAEARSSARGAGLPFTMETHVPFEDGHPKILAIYCSDGRYTEQVEALLNAKGHVLHDTITLPGGPGLFESWTGSFAMTDAVRRGSASSRSATCGPRGTSFSCPFPPSRSRPGSRPGTGRAG